LPGRYIPVPGRPPRRFALDHLDRDAGAREHRRERQAGDPAPDDQDALSAHRFTDRRARHRTS